MFLCWARRDARTTANEPVREAVELLDARRPGTTRWDGAERLREAVSSLGSAVRLAVYSEGVAVVLPPISVLSDRGVRDGPESPTAVSEPTSDSPWVSSESGSASASLMGGLGGGPCITTGVAVDSAWSSSTMGAAFESLVNALLTFLKNP